MSNLPMTSRSWRELVEKYDDEDRHKDSLYPVVYHMSGGRDFRDSGPSGGFYNPAPPAPTPTPTPHRGFFFMPLPLTIGSG